ncbi:hypothetical protein [Streptomyces sp. FH025]|uniref:hypothetical protein n=1 Tax=Streptomyces sp. FH025 TaxID=2815937 RepID=UPI001A9DC926|nr:hypothetical protein [Streptomyces sp. FH025]MBO1417889.1 hypothetical protein [Streptomyces sp. FH025]
MSKHRLAVPGAAVAALTLAALFVPVTGAHAAPAADSCTQNWSISSGQGYANGKWCNYNTKVVGSVHDTKADGRCPFVRGHLSNGGHVDSEWAGGKGKSRAITIYAPSGTQFTSLSMSYISC